MIIIALDPGGTTGWTTYDGQGYVQGYFGPEEHHEELFSFLERQRHQDTRVVYESFEYRHNQDKQRATVELISKEYIGVIKLFYQGLPSTTKLKAYTAGQHKPFWRPNEANSKLAQLGVEVHPKSRWPNMHINDSMSLMLHYRLYELNHKSVLQPLKGS
jgi:hypothetical protein